WIQCPDTAPRSSSRRRVATAVAWLPGTGCRCSTSVAEPASARRLAAVSVDGQDLVVVGDAPWLERHRRRVNGAQVGEPERLCFCPVAAEVKRVTGTVEVEPKRRMCPHPLDGCDAPGGLLRLGDHVARPGGVVGTRVATFGDAEMKM